MRTTVIYKLYSAKINKSFISYTTDMKRAMCNLKCYQKTGRVHRSKSADIIAQDDAECIVLQRYEDVQCSDWDLHYFGYTSIPD